MSLKSRNDETKINSLTHEKIIVRKMKFGLRKEKINNWHNNNPFISHFYNGMSIMFPVGEKFFIDSVRFYQDKVDDVELKACIKNFFRQEGHHTEAHIRYNALLEETGHNLKKLEHYTVHGAEIYHKKHPLTQLALVAAFEHFTAILANTFLRDRNLFFKNADPEFTRIWFWHSAEELEHKSVAYDVYLQMGGGYFRRCYAMYLATFRFFLNLTKSMFHLLKKDRQLFNIKMIITGFFYLFIYPGLLVRLAPEYFKYFLPGFHPWKTDNHYLVETWNS